MKDDLGKEYLKPQEKYNLKIDASDFRAATDTSWEEQLLGEDIYIIDIKIPYKYLYVPPCPFDIYLHSTKYINLIKVPQNVFIPLDIIDKIILVNPGISSGSMYFQYWLSDIESVKILDIYEKIGFMLPKGGDGEAIFMPFPTYQMKVYIKIPTNPTSIDFNINIQPINENHTFILDELDGTTEKFINNVYEYDKICGSGVVTDPHYPFPSWSTYVGLINNDVADDIVNCRLKIISWED